MTNADKIRSMSDEELFVFLTRSMNVLDTCVICTHFCCGYGDNYNCDEGVREWLKSDNFQLTTDKQKSSCCKMRNNCLNSIKTQLKLNSFQYDDDTADQFHNIRGDMIK